MSEQIFLVKKVIGKKDRCWVSYPKDVWLREQNRKYNKFNISISKVSEVEGIKDKDIYAMETVRKILCGKK